MGYSTTFKGCLKFAVPLTTKDLAHLSKFLGADIREHKEWKYDGDYPSYIDLKLTDDFSGIEWSGAEKTYGMVEAVNLIIREMRKVRSDFALSGKFVAAGEEIDDRWVLVIGKDGFAKKMDTPPVGEKITCPHCEESFYYESKSAKK